MREQKQKRQDRMILWICVIFAFVTCLAFAFLVVSFLFLGVCQVFNAKFSFVGIVEWLEGLPYVEIERAKLLKTQFIIGAVFFAFYLLIVVLLIINTVKMIRGMLLLSDTSVNELDPKQLATSIYTSCISCFTFVFSFIALTSPTTLNKLPDVTVLLFIVFGLLVALEIVIKNLYIFYNFKKGTFNKTNFALSLTRSFLLISIITTLFALTYDGYIYSFLQQIFSYKEPAKFALSFEFISLIVTPLQYLLTFHCVRVLNNTIRNSGLNMFEKAYDFYGKASYAPISSFKLYRDSIRKQTKRLISLSVICCILQLIPYFLNDWSFVVPNDIASILIKICGYYLFIILMAIAMRVACKIPVRYKYRIGTES